MKIFRVIKINDNILTTSHYNSDNMLHGEEISSNLETNAAEHNFYYNGVDITEILKEYCVDYLNPTPLEQVCIQLKYGSLYRTDLEKGEICATYYNIINHLPNTIHNVKIDITLKR